MPSKKTLQINEELFREWKKILNERDGELLIAVYITAENKINFLSSLPPQKTLLVIDFIAQGVAAHSIEVTPVNVIIDSN